MRSPLLLLVSGVAVVAACGRAPERWPMYDRAQVVEADSAMVVTVSPLATEVGVDILRRGGNAVDAAVAVGFALAVVHPSAGNIGGGGFMVFRFANGEVAALDYRETAPGAATRDMYLDPAGNVSDAIVTGHLASGVPGSVAGMAEAHRRYGRLPWADVIAPAARLAADGFVLDGARARGIAGNAERLARFPASARQFLPGGAAPDSGSVLVQADLARTLRSIADSGPAAFYEGWIADSIAAEMARGGGLITKADLAAYEPRWRDPIAFDYRGYTVYSMAPSSSGGITLALILNMLEGADSVPPLGSAEQVHLAAEVMKRAFADRNHYLGDPDFISMPIAQLISPLYAAGLRAGIRFDKATPSSALPGVAAHDQGVDTTHFSILDKDGNRVAATLSVNYPFGSGFMPPGSGVVPPIGGPVPPTLVGTRRLP